MRPEEIVSVSMRWQDASRLTRISALGTCKELIRLLIARQSSMHMYNKPYAE